MFKKIIALSLLIICVLLCCVQKRQWQGKYITLKTTEFPKEDFLVGNYVVVSYTPRDYAKKSDIIYRFDIMKEGKKVRVIEFSECFLLITEKPDPNIYDKEKDYDYALTEINPSDFGKMDHSLFVDVTTYKLYEKLHSYEEIKQEVIDVLLGRPLLSE